MFGMFNRDPRASGNAQERMADQAREEERRQAARSPREMSPQEIDSRLGQIEADAAREARDAGEIRTGAVPLTGDRRRQYDALLAERLTRPRDFHFPGPGE